MRIVIPDLAKRLIGVNAATLAGHAAGKITEKYTENVFMPLITRLAVEVAVSAASRKALSKLP